MKSNFKLSYYLDDLRNLKEISTEQLDDLAEKYPAVANIHFLRAKKYQSEGNTNALHVFEKTSFTVFDHVHLYYRMTNSELESAIENRQKEAEILESTGDDVTLFESEMDRAIAALKKADSDKSKEVLEMEGIKSSDQISDSKEEIIKSIPFESTPNDMIGININKIQDVYSINDEEFNELSSYSQWLLRLNPQSHSVVFDLDPEKKYKAPKAMHELKRDEVYSDKKLKKKKKNEAKITDYEKELNEASKEKKKNKKKKKKKDVSIKQRAKRSLELSQELVTEPLAELLASQGHTDEAIIMFTKLSLIIPEKSSYFADRIKRLKIK